MGPAGSFGCYRPSVRGDKGRTGKRTTKTRRATKGAQRRMERRMTKRERGRNQRESAKERKHEKRRDEKKAGTSNSDCFLNCLFRVFALSRFRDDSLSLSS